MDIKTLRLETENLLLVPTVMDYVEDIFANFDKETTRYMAPKYPNHIEETIEWIKDVLIKREDHQELQMTILDKNTKEFLGNAWLHNIKTKTPELWIWIKQSAYWRKFWREAVWALIKWANENLDFEYLVYPVDHRNIASRKIAESFAWVVESNSDWEMIITLTETQDPDKILETVVYKISKK
jgi:[ribosomal protein S5]-alanine N-acetyltransferase